MGIRQTLLRVTGRGRRAVRDVDPSGPRTSEVDDRRAQLGQVVDVCTRMGELLARHGDPGAAQYRKLAAEAGRLLEHGFDRSELRALGEALPRGSTAPDWTNPKAIDSGLQVEPWQVEAARWRSRAAALAIDLRAVDGS